MAADLFAVVGAATVDIEHVVTNIYYYYYYYFVVKPVLVGMNLEVVDLDVVVVAEAANAENTLQNIAEENQTSL